MNNFKQAIKKQVDQAKKQYRNLKDKINPKTGSKIYSIVKISLIVDFFLLVPILFTILSTLAGNGQISYTAYEIVQWVTLGVLIIELITLLFFKEYPRKVILEEAKSEQETTDETKAIVEIETID